MIAPCPTVFCSPRESAVADARPMLTMSSFRCTEQGALSHSSLNGPSPAPASKNNSQPHQETVFRRDRLITGGELRECLTFIANERSLTRRSLPGAPQAPACACARDNPQSFTGTNQDGEADILLPSRPNEPAAQRPIASGIRISGAAARATFRSAPARALRNRRKDRANNRFI